MVNFPHNPTGALPSRTEFAAVVEGAVAAGARVFSDEMYRLLERDPGDRLPAACELREDALSLTGMSKVFGLAGARIGWLVARDPETVSALAEFKDYTTICSSAPSEVLALIGLRARTALVERHRARIARNLATLESFVARHGERFALAPPRAGSVCLLRLRGGHATDFCRRLVDRAGIMLLPSSVFQFGDEHVRVGLGRQDMPDVLARLEEALSDPES